MASPNTQAAMAEYFDFEDSSAVEAPNALAESAPAVSSGHSRLCPAHGKNGVDGCLCHGFQGDYELPADLGTDQTEPDDWNPDFSTWIPRYSKPAHPCDYCRSKSLECFFYDGANGLAGCSPCNALFRPCSFSQPKNRQASSKTMDTLCVVEEAGAPLFGGLTGKSQPMRVLGHTGPIEKSTEDNGLKKGASAIRFPRAAVKILKDWMAEHHERPYPTEEEKEELKNKTGLTASQVSNWMANTRRRQKARPKRSASPSIRPSTGAINIPPGKSWESMNPFERWKHSPPENEPAPLTAIAQAVETFNPPVDPNSLAGSLNDRKTASNESTGSFSVFRAPSTTSLETGFTNMSSGSAQSFGTAWSYGSRNSLGSLNSNGRKERRRRRRVPVRPPKLDSDAAAARVFQCTFCTDRFKSKYDWARHEKSLHLSLEKWICAPLGEVVACTASGQQKCVFCDKLDPSKEHLETHNYRTCEEKGLEARTFYRKDHLRQHLRLMHGCKMTVSMESWKAEAQFINSRCGFCAATFTKWQDRVDHLSKEFRNGREMKDWKGCRGLDPHVAAQVSNAMPPYLIANESLSPLPFSASNATTMTNHTAYAQNDLEYLIPSQNFSASEGQRLSQEGYTASPQSGTQSNTGTSSSTSPPHPRATCWEILTLRLGRYSRKYMEEHGPNTLTDDILQQEARRILYDSDDPWNQTAADNLEWLGLFKKAHGIDTSGRTSHIGRHEVLEDLGLNTGSLSLMDQSFDLTPFEFTDRTQDQRLAYECSLAGTTRLSHMAQRRILEGSPKKPPISPASSNHTAAPTHTPALSHISTIAEFPCTTFGDPIPGMDHFTASTWDQPPKGISSAAPSLSQELLAGDPGLELGSIDWNASGADPMPSLQWNDAELGFDMELDPDFELAMQAATLY